MIFCLLNALHKRSPYVEDLYKKRPQGCNFKQRLLLLVRAFKSFKRNENKDTKEMALEYSFSTYGLRFICKYSCPANFFNNSAISSLH